MIGIFFVLALGLTVASVVAVLTLFTLMLDTGSQRAQEPAPGSGGPVTLRSLPHAANWAAANSNAVRMIA